MEKDISDEEKAFQCLGTWRKLFDGNPMPKQWTSTWSKQNVESFWYSTEDLWAVFDEAEADAIVAYNKNTQSAEVFLIIAEPRGLESALNEIKGYF